MSLLGAIAAVYAGHVPIPYNPIHLPFETALSAAVFLPQGWKFFTRNPRAETTFVMERTARGWSIAEGSATGSLANALGASRRGRARSVELGQLMAQVPKSDWSDCDRTPGACLEEISTPVRLKAAGRRPQLCGIHGIVSQRGLPWAWRDANPPVVMPSRVLLLEVQC
jgi:antimicrobial peptide system SdpA family protein